MVVALVALAVVAVALAVALPLTVRAMGRLELQRAGREADVREFERQGYGELLQSMTATITEAARQAWDGVLAPTLDVKQPDDREVDDQLLQPDEAFAQFYNPDGVDPLDDFRPEAPAGAHVVGKPLSIADVDAALGKVREQGHPRAPLLMLSPPSLLERLREAGE